MDATDPFVTRRGLRAKRSSTGSWLFVIGLGAVVAGLGVAGLRYGRPEIWDRPTQSSQPATTTPEPVGTAEVTSADTDTPARPSILKPEAPTTERKESSVLADPGAAPAAAPAAAPPKPAAAPPRAPVQHRAPPKKDKEKEPAGDEKPAATTTPDTETDPFGSMK